MWNNNHLVVNKPEKAGSEGFIERGDWGSRKEEATTKTKTAQKRENSICGYDELYIKQNICLYISINKLEKKRFMFIQS